MKSFCETANKASTKAEEADTAAESAPARRGNYCSKCGGPAKGHKGLYGQKYTVVLTTPEKVCHAFLHPDSQLPDSWPGKKGGGQTFCDLQTILHLSYLISHAISPAQWNFLPVYRVISGNI